MASGSPFGEALALIGSFDRSVFEIVWLSLRVSFAAVALAVALAGPAALGIALGRFPGRRALRGIVRAFMMIPAVLIGLLVYMFLGRRGAAGGLELLYTPWAIVIAQALLAFPLITALFVTALEAVDPLVLDAARTAGAGRVSLALAASRESAASLFAAVLTGFARVIGETGMTLMVGGNILSETRTMTTAIATETMRGEFETAIALGIILFAVSIVLNLALLLLEPATDARSR